MDALLRCGDADLLEHLHRNRQGRFAFDALMQLDRFNDRGTFSGDLGINAFVPGDILGPNVIPTPLLDPSSGFNIDIDALGRPIPQFRHFFPTNPRIPYAGPTLGLF